MTMPTGPDATDVIARLRRYLADDLDTPMALAAVDGWVADSLEYGGRDASAPAALGTAIDALMGVPT
jgi:L-cysteine:1D-myo-inositol 2-amino-2-deoxy-alpha-D-glucopyranoside ligase